VPDKTAEPWYSRARSYSRPTTTTCSSISKRTAFSSGANCCEFSADCTCDASTTACSFYAETTGRSRKRSPERYQPLLYFFNIFYFQDLSLDTRNPYPYYPAGPPPALLQEYKTPLLQASGPEIAPHVRTYNAGPPPRMNMPPPHLPPPRLPISPSGDVNIPANIMDFLRHIPPPAFPPTPPGNTPTSSTPAHEPPLAGPFGQSKSMPPPQSHKFPGNTPSSSQYSKISPSFNSSSDPFNPSFLSTIFPPASTVLSSSSQAPLRPSLNASIDETTPPDLSKPRQREPWQTHRRGPSSPGGTDFFPHGESPFSFPEPVSTTQPIGSNRPVNMKAPTVGPASSNLYFPSTTGFSTSKPVLDPDSYDRKIR